MTPINGDYNNMYVAGAPVSVLNAELQPTNTVYLQGATQAAINAGFANPVSKTGTFEVVSVARSGAAPLTIDIPTICGIPGATQSQFHGFG